jgi:hypothetical protein
MSFAYRRSNKLSPAFGLTVAWVLDLEPARPRIVCVGLSFGNDAFQIESANSLKQFPTVLVYGER